MGERKRPGAEGADAAGAPKGGRAAREDASARALRENLKRRKAQARARAAGAAAEPDSSDGESDG